LVACASPDASIVTSNSAAVMPATINVPTTSRPRRVSRTRDGAAAVRVGRAALVLAAEIDAERSIGGLVHSPLIGTARITRRPGRGPLGRSERPAGIELERGSLPGALAWAACQGAGRPELTARSGRCPPSFAVVPLPEVVVGTGTCVSIAPSALITASN
jgi:hypothetical protein